MKNNKFFLVILFLGFAGIIIYLKYDGFAFGRYEKNILKISIEPYKASQLAYKNTYKGFNINKDAVKKSFVLPSEVTGYVDINDIPTEYKLKVSKEDQPFLGETGYKVIFIVDSKKFKRQAIWVFDNVNLLKKIYPVESK